MGDESASFQSKHLKKDLEASGEVASAEPVRSERLMDLHKHFVEGAAWTEHILFVKHLRRCKDDVLAIGGGPANSKLQPRKHKAHAKRSAALKAMLGPEAAEDDGPEDVEQAVLGEPSSEEEAKNTEDAMGEDL